MSNEEYGLLVEMTNTLASINVQLDRIAGQLESGLGIKK